MAGHENGMKTDGLRKPPIPVDKGWAWFIMVGSYLDLMLVVAFARSLAVFLPEILNIYQQPAAVTTLALGLGDLSWVATNMVIPTILLPRFSVRSLALVGSFLHCFSVIGLAYSPNIIVFNCIFPVVTFADCLLIIPPLIHVGHFFKKRLSLANGIIHAGSSTATVIVPLLAQFLLEKYGYQGALLILSGISFNCIAASMLLRPLSMYDDSTSQVIPKTSNTFIGDPMTSLELGYLQLEPGEANNTQEEKYIHEKSQFLESEDSNHTQTGEAKTLSDFSIAAKTGTVNGDLNDGVTSERLQDEFFTYSEAVCNAETEEAQTLLPKMTLTNNVNNISNYNKNSTSPTQLHKHDNILNSYTTCGYSQNNIKEEKDYTETVSFSQINDKMSNEIGPTLHPLISQKATDTTLEATSVLIQSGKTDGESSHDKKKENDSSSRFCRIRKIGAFVSSTVLSNPVAVMLILAGGLSTPGGNMYMPVLGLENGLSSEEVPWMIIIIGVSDVVGKLGFGFFADLGYLRPIRIVCFTQLTAGLTCQFTKFYKGFGSMAAMATIYGLTAGIVQSLLSSMIIEMIGLQHLAQVLSFINLGTGLSTFILNVSVGALRDATGFFSGGYNLVGAMLLTSLVIMLLEPFFVKCRDRGIHSRKSAVPQNSSV